MEAVERQDDRDPERADDLDIDTELRHAAHHLGAGDVEDRLDQQEQHRDPEDREVVPGIEVPPEPVVGERGEVADDPGVDRGDGDQQCEPVEPADEPAVAGADGELRVLVQRPCHRVVAGELTEDQGDQQHPRDRDEVQPDVRRSGHAEAQREQRVDAHHRREVGERDREVGEESEDPTQLWLVAQAREPGIVVVGVGGIGGVTQWTLRNTRAAATGPQRSSPGPAPTEPRPSPARKRRAANRT